MFETIVAGLIVVFVAWVVGYSRKKWLPVIRSRAAGLRTDLHREEQAGGARRLGVLREQVVDVARARGVTLPVSVKGTSPARVEYSSGEVRLYYPDRMAYTRALRSGAASPTRTFYGSPPIPVAAWDEARLVEWLSDNAE
jgi:hypothetical protein